MRALGLALALALAACGGGSAPEAPTAVALEAPKDALVKTVENGPVVATVTVWPAKPSLGDAIYARLSIEAPAGISIDAPFQEAGDQRLGRFKVIGFDRATERLPGGGQRQDQTYTLEAYASGRHRIPPLRIEMLDSRAGAPSGSAGSGAGSAGAIAGKPQEILTDEISLEIAPVKTEAVDADLAPVRGALDERVGGTSPLVIAGIVSALLVLVSGSLLAYRGLRSRRRVQQQRSAYDDAVAALRALESRGAPDPEAADAWFVELSAIVRRYLEQRYEVRAPELTTEEFLLVATARPELGGAQRDQLSTFLESCDRVKFAGYRPSTDESLAALAAARSFVEDTRLRLAEAA